MKFNPFSSLVEITGSEKLGIILLKMGAITLDDLNKSLHIKKDNPEKLIGQIMIEKGFSTKNQVNSALDEQRKENRLGRLLLSSGLINQLQLDEALEEQRQNREKLGAILVHKGFCTEVQIQNALKFQKRDNRLGTLLVREGYISEEELNQALDLQADKGFLLGESLINLNLITSQQLTDVLLKQSRTL
jgi:hypothetical protein